MRIGGNRVTPKGGLFGGPTLWGMRKKGGRYAGKSWEFYGC